MPKIKFIFFFLILISSCSSYDSSVKKMVRNESILTPNTIFNKTKSIFLNADSIFLIGHTGREFRKNNGLVKPSPIESLIINEQINSNILKKKASIKQPDIDSLLSILKNSPDTMYEYNQSKCLFDPHHAIVIFKQKSISFIRVCFDCRLLEESEDLKVIEPLDSTQWDRLENIFKINNARYYP